MFYLKTWNHSTKRRRAENIQAQGGMGFTWEFDCHLYYRRAQLLSSIIGAQPQWKEAVATRLLSAA